MGVLAGGALAFAAFLRLGDALTYFGIEYGVAEYEHVSGFPYGTIPHPMIAGMVVLLVAAGLHPNMKAYRMHIGAHCAIYAVVLALEEGQPATFADQATFG